jgi:hypothetical protein
MKQVVIENPVIKTLKPILRPYDTIGSTRYVDFDTTRPTYETDPQKCHISHVVADTESWEQKLAQTLEEMPEVVCYVKNHNLGFAFPYTIDGDEKNYIPDFIVRFQGADGELINLIIRSDRGEEKREAGKSSHGQKSLGPGGEHPCRSRAVGHCGNHRPLGRPDPYPGFPGDPARVYVRPLRDLTT